MPMLKRGYGAVRNLRGKSGARFPPSTVWVVVKVMVPFVIPITIRHLILGYPKRDHTFDNHPYVPKLGV